MKYARIPVLAALLLCANLAVAAQQPPGPPAPTPAIAGVVDAGTTIEVVKDGLEAVEGPVPLPNGDVLFTNNQTGQILRVAQDGSISAWREAAGGVNEGVNALAWLPSGELVATMNVANIVGVVKPGEPARALASQFDGKPLNRPNDIVISKLGHIYFTDSAPMGVANPPLPSALYQITDKGELLQVTTSIGRPNGVALSPDERTLYVADTSGEWIVAFPLDANGRAGEKRNFARLALPPARGGGQATASGTDGLAVDQAGRVFAATTLGVQVVSPTGEPLGTITLPRQPQNLTFGGPNRSVLYVFGRGSVYRIPTLTRGPNRAGK